MRWFCVLLIVAFVCLVGCGGSSSDAPADDTPGAALRDSSGGKSKGLEKGQGDEHKSDKKGQSDEHKKGDGG